MTTPRSMQDTSPQFSLSKPALINSIAQISSGCLCGKDVCTRLVAGDLSLSTWPFWWRNKIWKSDFLDEGIALRAQQTQRKDTAAHCCFTGAAGIYSSQRHGAPAPSCFDKIWKLPSLLKRRATNERLMAKGSPSCCCGLCRRCPARSGSQGQEGRLWGCSSGRSSVKEA